MAPFLLASVCKKTVTTVTDLRIETDRSEREFPFLLDREVPADLRCYYVPDKAAVMTVAVVRRSI